MELATPPVSGYEKHLSAFQEINQAFDEGFKGDWVKWDALDSFCDRLAQGIFKQIDEAMKPSFDPQSLSHSGLLRFPFRRRESGEVGDSWSFFSISDDNPLSPEYWDITVEKTLGPEESLPLAERMLFKLCVHGRRHKYIEKGVERQQLLKSIGDNTLQKVQALMEEVKDSLKDTQLEVSFRPIYLASIVANSIITALLIPTVVGFLWMTTHVDQGGGVKEKCNGPIGCEVRWKVKFPWW